jgi:DNA helicase II / ATP-dependent DNA helicase PcrA
MPALTGDSSTLPRPATSAASGTAPVSLEAVSRLLRGLNREQRRAVTHGEGPQLVLAGPGTGKTEVITRRIAWLIATKRALPRQIVALTFTDKAAAEMQARVDALLPYGQSDSAIHTFHAFGDRLLREHAFELGLAGDVRLIGRAEAISLMRDNLFELGLERYRPLGDPSRFLGALIDLFSRAKDEGIEPSTYVGFADLLTRQAVTATADQPALVDRAAAQSELARAYELYQRLLAQRGLVDHGDQVALPVRLLRERPHVSAELRRRYRYLLVDEFQDSSPVQLELVLALCGRQRNATVVGDDDQAIYTFRGAAASNMRRFAAAQPDLRCIVLRRNYRSHAPILAASQRLIAHNGKERLATIDGLDKHPIAHRRSRRPAPLRVLAFRDPEEEADGIAATIASRLESGRSPRDFAVLLRTNGEVLSFVRSLLARGVPATSSAPTALLGRPEVRPLLALLRVVADPSDTVELYALASARPYAIGGADLTALLSRARSRHRPLWEVLAEVVDQPGVLRLQARNAARVAQLVADVRAAIEQSHVRPAGEVLYDHLKRTGRLSQLARRDGPENDLLDVVRFFDLVRGQGRLLADDRVPVLVPHLAAIDTTADEPADAGPEPVDAVQVLTVHRAKGLEFRVVFVAGLADGRFPLRARQPTLSLPAELCARPEAGPAGDELSEERRLCYVAMTRARDELWLSHSLAGAGRRIGRRPSLFLGEALDAPIESVGIERSGADRLVPAPIAGDIGSRAAVGAQQRSRLSLSFSQLDDYLTCPERYRLRHVVGVPTPAHHSLAYGNALHQAVAIFHLHQAKGGPMSQEQLLDAFASHWSGEGFLSREHEEARFTAGQAALRRFRQRQLAPDASVPVAVERPFAFRLGDNELRGRIDRLDHTPDGDVITDYKSSDVRDQRKADQKARESLQLQVYALAHAATSGSLPARLQLHFLDGDVIGRTVPDEARLERASHRIEQAAGGIRAANFPARPNPVSCGYCPYRTICTASAA